jgi:hypothetical protein
MKMKKKLDSPGEEETEAGRGDESGTGPDLLEDVLASLYLLGEHDLAAAKAKADAEMKEYRDWLLTREPIQYLGVIVKGRNGVRVKDPVTMTRFSGTVEPKDADGDIEIVRLDAAGERRNVLLRCPLRGIGPQGAILHRKYKRIKQTLTVKITPNERGGFNLDVAVRSEGLAMVVGGGSPVSNGGGKRTRAARAGAAGTGEGYNTRPLAHGPAPTPPDAGVPPALRYAVMGVLTIAVGLGLSRFAADLICRHPPTSTARVVPAVSSGAPAPAPEVSRDRGDMEVRRALFRPDSMANAGARPEVEKPDRGQKPAPVSARGVDNSKESKRRDKLASIGRIVIVITPGDTDPEEVFDMQKVTINLKQSGFTEVVAQKKPNVLVMSKPDDAQATKTMFIRIADGAGEKDDCAEQAKADEQDTLLLLSEILAADLPAAELTAAISDPTRQCVEREVRVESDGATDEAAQATALTDMH